MTSLFEFQAEREVPSGLPDPKEERAQAVEDKTAGYLQTDPGVGVS